MEFVIFFVVFDIVFDVVDRILLVRLFVYVRIEEDEVEKEVEHGADSERFRCSISVVVGTPGLSTLDTACMEEHGFL